MKKFTSILATALIAASLFLSSPFPASGDNSLTKIIHFQKTDPSTRSISDADLPEASIRNDLTEDEKSALISSFSVASESPCLWYNQI